MRQQLATNRFFEILDEPVITDDAAAPRAVARRGGAELVFEHVNFSYPDVEPGSPPALVDVSLRIAPGETVAVVGATGSGKTTLAAVVPRLYEPTSGRIMLDGVDIAKIPRAELRRLVAVAFDEPALFSTTAAENVLMGAESVDDTGLERALQIAQATDFVQGLPLGAQTQVGESGLRLSGGQRQRLALARTVIGSPRLLVLDDPLSALDIHTGVLVEAALRQILPTTDRAGYRSQAFNRAACRPGRGVVRGPACRPSVPIGTCLRSSPSTHRS